MIKVEQRKSEKLDKLKAHCEKLKCLSEKKDIELKRLRALTKEPMKKSETGRRS